MCVVWIRSEQIITPIQRIGNYHKKGSGCNCGGRRLQLSDVRIDKGGVRVILQNPVFCFKEIKLFKHVWSDCQLYGHDSHSDSRYDGDLHTVHALCLQPQHNLLAGIHNSNTQCLFV